MNGTTIRRAEPRDLGPVNGLLQQVLTVHHHGRPDLFNATGKKYTFVYEKDGAVLGYAFCALQHMGNGSLKDITTLYIDDLCVDERARGQHIGEALFKHVQSFAAEKGGHNITLHVWDCNPGARAFYDAMGLKPLYTSMELILQ